MSQIIDEYGYRPQFTGQTESSLFDLFQRITGQGNYAGAGNGDVNAIPFDIGLPTTGIYDSLTRGIKQDYLGTPGGPQGGSIADSQAYFNNLGIPEQALNATRLGYQDMNNSLLDKAALINESQKDRLMSLLVKGTDLGSDLYSQNLNQHRFNTGTMQDALYKDIGIQDTINQSNQSNINSLLGSGGSDLGSMAATGVGTYFGGPAGGAIANLGYNALMGGQTPTNKGSYDTSTGSYIPYKGSSSSSTAKMINGSK
jgi:hypothetical protein